MNSWRQKRVGARWVCHTPHPGPLPVRGEGVAMVSWSPRSAPPSPLKGERARVRGVTSPPRSHATQSLAAFTLLELLIAVSIFAMVLTAINGVFYGAMRLQKSASRTVEASLPLQQTVASLKRDL